MKKFLYGIVLGSLLTCSFYALVAWNPFSSSKVDTKPDTSKYQSEITRQKIQERAAARAAQAAKPTTATSTTSKQASSIPGNQTAATRTSPSKKAPSSLASQGLASKTITMTNTTGKELVIKSGKIEYPILPGQTKTFTFASLEKAGIGYKGSMFPYRPLDLGSVYAKFALPEHLRSNNVKANLIPATWAAKIDSAKVVYGTSNV
jgi:hypothetical protein